MCAFKSQVSSTGKLNIPSLEWKAAVMVGSLGELILKNSKEQLRHSSPKQICHYLYMYKEDVSIRITKNKRVLKEGW